MMRDYRARELSESADVIGNSGASVKLKVMRSIDSDGDNRLKIVYGTDELVFRGPNALANVQALIVLLETIAGATCTVPT